MARPKKVAPKKEPEQSPPAPEAQNIVGDCLGAIELERGKPLTTLGQLKSLRDKVEGQRAGVTHREHSLGLESLSSVLDQAIRWAKNVEDVVANIEAKAKK